MNKEESSNSNTAITEGRTLKVFSLARVGFINMKIQIVVWLLVWLAGCQVNHTAISPKIVHVRVRPSVQEVPARHSFKETYAGMGYEISGEVYETDRELSMSEIYNKNAYSLSSTCIFYNSELDLEVVNDIKVEDDWKIETYFISETSKAVFLLLSNDNYNDAQNTTDRVIVTYDFDSSSYTRRNDNISVASLGLRDESTDIAMFEIKNVLLVTDGVKIVGVDVMKPSRNWEIKVKSDINGTIIDYAYAATNELLKFEFTHIDYNSQIVSFLMVWNSAILLFSASPDMTTATLQLQILPPPTKLFYDVLSERHTFYALVDQQLVVYRLAKDGSVSSRTVELESKECFRINKYESTIHTICREGGVNYVAEFYFNETFHQPEEALKLNRYYNQVSDADLILRFGSWENPKLLISGDQQIFITAYAINRQVLTEANRPQPSKRLKGLGVEDIKSIEEFSSPVSTFAVGVGTTFLSFFRIKESPAEIECISLDREVMSTWNVLVQINTTSCLANGDIEQLESICSISIPYVYQIATFEVDSTKQTSITLFGFIFMLVIAILLLGCAFHCKSLRERAMAELRKKMDKLKKRGELKPI